MKKHFIVTIFLILFFAGVIIGQMYFELKADFISADYSTSKPANGHSWAEMECTEGLCIDSANDRVGIGVSNPAYKLDIVGSVHATGDISSAGNINSAGTIVSSGNISSSGTITAATDVCNGAGACLSQISNFVASQPLINNVHNYSACTAAGGEVVSVGASYPLCRFNAASCPSGWTQYQNWATYGSHSACYYTCCSNGGAAWANHSSNNPTFSCTVIYSCCGSDGEYSQLLSWSGESVRSQIGCY